MWTEPYLETCCRAALHRLALAGNTGRPVAVPDQPCLSRLAAMALAELSPASRYVMTGAGQARHRSEILRQR